MSENKKFNDLVYQIYNTVDEPDTWQEVLAAVAQELDSSHIFLAARAGADQQPFAFVESGFDQGYFDLYQQYFYQMDIWTLSMLKFAPNQVYNSHQLCDDREFVKSEIYNDFAKPVGIRHGTGGLMIDAEQGMLAEIGIMRSKERGYYDEEIRLRAAGLTPHIRQALSIAQRMKQLGSSTEDFQQLLNNSDEAILICDGQNKLLQHNNAAEQLLNNSGLIRLTLSKQLIFNDSKARTRYEAIKTKMGLRIHASSSESFTLGNQHSAYRLKAQAWLHSQVTALGVAKIPAFMLTLRPISSARPLSVQNMVMHFGFTTAEAEVAKLLCQGQLVEEIATTRNASLHTVRKQIKICLQKTDCRSQAELVSKVLMALME